MRDARRRGTRTITAMVAALLTVGAFAVGCADPAEQTSDAGSKLTDIRVALIPTGSVLPVYAAEAEGIFARNGLRVARAEGRDLSAMTAGLAQGDYDLAMSVPTLVLVGASRGLDVQVVSTMQRSTAEKPNAVWVTKDPSIDSLAKLKGKKIGVPALTGVITDSLVYLLAKQGVERDQAEFISMPFPTMGDQLKADNVDAVVAPIPFSSALAARGFSLHEDVVVEAVTDASAGRIDTGINALFVASSTFARENADIISAWRKSLTEAIEYLETHDAQARKYMQQWLKMPPKVAQQAPLPSWQVEVSPEDLRPYVTISKAIGTIKTEPDVNALVWQAGP